MGIVRNSFASLKFDGNTDNAATTAYHSDFDLIGDFTISVMGLARRNASITQRFFSKSSGNANNYGIGINSNGAIQFTIYGAVDINFANTIIPENDWFHLVVTQTSGTYKMYINGMIAETKTGQTQPSATDSQTVFVGQGRTNENFAGYIDEVRVWKGTVLTAAQILSLYRTGINPTTSGLVAEWLLNEGAGTSSLDTSGQTHNLTIAAGADWNAEAPSKPRPSVGGNLVKNGDFSYVPPFTAATTTASRFIDGTASGSATNSTFGWAIYLNGAGNSAQLATNSAIITLTTGGAGNLVTLANHQALNTGGAVTSAYLAPISPSTPIKITVRYRTVGGTAAAANSVQLRCHQYTAAPASAATEVSSSRQSTMLTTLDGSWESKTLSFTTTSTTSHLLLGVVQGNSFGASNGNSGQAVEVSNISVTPTTNTTRTAVT